MLILIKYLKRIKKMDDYEKNREIERIKMEMEDEAKVGIGTIIIGTIIACISLFVFIIYGMQLLITILFIPVVKTHKKKLRRLQ